MWPESMKATFTSQASFAQFRFLMRTRQSSKTACMSTLVRFGTSHIDVTNDKIQTTRGIKPNETAAQVQRTAFHVRDLASR